MGTKKAIRYLAILCIAFVIFFAVLISEIKNNREGNQSIIWDSTKKASEEKPVENKATSTADSEWEAGREERIKEADELMIKMTSEASTTEWEAGREERVKAADEIMQKQISDTDAAEWEAGKEARIKAADELMRKMMDKQE